MEDGAKKLAIQLDDGRIVVGTPKPEDQGRLDQLDQEIVLLTASGDYDTGGHGYSDEIALDVEGHAITLRLPTPADAEAVRKALAVGAVTATIVAAGAIAAIQGSPAAPIAPAPAAPVVAPAPGPHPATQAEQDRDLGIMDMTSQPGVQAPAAPVSPATQAEQDRDLGIMDMTSQPGVQAPAAPPAAVERGDLPVPQAGPDFREQRDQAVDDMLESGPAGMPIVDEPSSQRGGPR